MYSKIRQNLELSDDRRNLEKQREDFSFSGEKKNGTKTIIGNTKL